jgi:rod shape-determining protein MreC
MLKRSNYIALGIVVVLTLILLNLPAHTTARLKAAISSLFLPLFGLAHTTDQAANKAGDMITTRSELLKQNEQLHNENQELRLQAVQAQETARENARLRQNLGWKETRPWKGKLAKVVVRDPSNWWKSVQIDKGRLDGITNNLPVVTMEGLVGRISAVGPASSTVVLIGDRDCKVAAKITETGDLGVIGSTDLADNSLVTLGFLNKNAKLTPGEEVMTSGVGGFFPAGIPVGKIVDARQVDSGLSSEARVKLTANLNSLDEVWVVFP